MEAKKCLVNFKKTKIVIIIAVVLMLIIFLIRGINAFRYSNASLGISSVNIQDMSTYPLKFDGLQVSKINQNMLNGFHIQPTIKTTSGVVVTFGGSEGGCNYFNGIELAKKGYEVITLFFFGQDNQPLNLNKVPLEFFNEFLLYAQSNNIDIDMLTLLGGSKGAELSLLLTNYYQEIDNIILYSPSSYVFQGLNFNDVGSSWTYNQIELPYISLLDASPQSILGMFSAMIFNYPVSYLSQYETAIQNTVDPPNAKIDITLFDGNILLFAGDDDAMWHSAVMAEEIYMANPQNTQLTIYENVGHIFNAVTYANGLKFGGVKEKNEAARIDSDSRLLEFLSKHHKQQKN